MRGRVVGIAVLAALSIATPALAQDRPLATGRLTLYSEPDFTGDSRAVSYGACPHVTATGLDQVGSFSNTPAPGCLVTLVNPGGDVHRLCAGRGKVPAAFSAATQVRVVRGVSTPCPG